MVTPKDGKWLDGQPEGGLDRLDGGRTAVWRIFTKRVLLDVALHKSQVGRPIFTSARQEAPQE